jgi:hypothetical protein
MGAMTAAVLLFWGYGAIGTFDVLYYHFYRFRLYERPECFQEHLLHTANVLVTPMIVAGLYIGVTGGHALWLGTGFAVTQLIVLLWDVVVEPDSRARLGGLPAPEYVIHIVVCMMHAASLALVLASRPSGAWSGSAPMWLEPIRWDARDCAMVALCVIAVPLGILHVVLAVRGSRAIRAGRSEPAVGGPVVGSIVAS